MYTQSLFVAALASVAVAADQAANNIYSPPGYGGPSYVQGGYGGGYGPNKTIVTTTKVVQAYTTYCPGPTTLSFNNKFYTVTAATTLTIKDCPCTIVEPCHTCAAVPTVPVVAPVAPGVVVPGNAPAVAPAAPTRAAVAPAVAGAPAAVAPGAAAAAPVAPGKAAQAPAAAPAPAKAVEVAGADGRHVAYTLALAAAGGLVGYLAL